MEATAADFFGRRAREYDSLILRCVPRYGEMLDRLIHYLPPGNVRVLELGAGTGNLSLALAARSPAAELVLVDASPEMLEVAAGRLAEAGTGDRARTLVARFEALPEDLGEFDLVTSSISLHHVVDKGALYARLAAALVPGGHFVFADQLRGVDERVHAINWKGWLEFCGAPGNCTPDEVQALLEHAAEHDHYTPLAEHFRLLEAAGFGDLDCVWRNWIWGIVQGRRPV